MDDLVTMKGKVIYDKDGYVKIFGKIVGKQRNVQMQEEDEEPEEIEPTYEAEEEQEEEPSETLENYARRPKGKRSGIKIIGSRKHKRAPKKQMKTPPRTVHRPAVAVFRRRDNKKKPKVKRFSWL